MLYYFDIPTWGVGWAKDLNNPYLCVKVPTGYHPKYNVCDLWLVTDKAPIHKSSTFNFSKDVYLDIKRCDGWIYDITHKHSDNIKIESLLGYYSPITNKITLTPNYYGEQIKSISTKDI